MSDPVQDLLDNAGGGAPAFKFTNFGDRVTGTVTSRRVKDIPAMKPGDPARPTLIIDLRADDGSEHALFVKEGQMTAALGRAVKEAGRQTIVVGDRMAVEFTHTEKASKAGYNDKKMFAVAYKAGAQQPEPVAAAAGVDLSSLI